MEGIHAFWNTPRLGIHGLCYRTCAHTKTGANSIQARDEGREDFSPRFGAFFAASPPAFSPPPPTPPPRHLQRSTPESDTTLRFGVSSASHVDARPPRHRPGLLAMPYPFLRHALPRIPTLSSGACKIHCSFSRLSCGVDIEGNGARYPPKVLELVYGESQAGDCRSQSPPSSSA